MAAAEQVNMNMIDSLAAVVTGIDHGAIALFESLAARDLRGSQQQMTEKLFVFLAGVCGGCDVATRNNENVYWSHRPDVNEGVAFVVLIDCL